MKEWRSIPGFNGYDVSSDGEVRSWRCRWGTRKRPLVLAQQDINGYRQVKLYPDRKSRRVHTLVLLAFVGPRPENHEGGHMNGKRDDNKVENLVWITGETNIAMRSEHGTTARGERSGRSKLTEKDVRMMRRMREDGAPYTKIGALFSVTRQHARVVCNNTSWRHV